MQPITPRQTWIVYATAVIMIVLIAVYAVLSLRLVLNSVTPELLISIPDATIEPDDPIVCPGELLRYDLTITYNRDGVLMDITRNLRNLDTGALVVIDGVLYSEKFSVPQEIAGTFERNAVWLVPQLIPGNYRLITSTQNSTGSEILQYYVTFTVTPNCGQRGD